MYRIAIVILMILTCLLPLTAAAAEGTVPKAATMMAQQMDSQIMRRVGTYPEGRACVSIVSTVPVFLGNLEQSSPLARQMAEEVMRCFVEAGYRVEEIRKGKEIVMTPRRGETILTRQTTQLADRDVSTVAVLAGTYTVTRDSVRFNLKLLHATSNEVLASSSATVPVTSELFPLLADRGGNNSMPSVFTRLR